MRRPRQTRPPRRPAESLSVDGPAYCACKHGYDAVNYGADEYKIFELEAQVASAPSSKPAASAPSSLPSLHIERRLLGHRQGVTCLAFHPEFGLLASGSEDMTIMLWNLDTGRAERTIRGHVRGVTSIDFSAHSEVLLASASSDAQIRVYDALHEYRLLRTLTGHRHTVSQVRFGSGASLLFSCSRDETVRMWDAARGVCLRTLDRAGLGWLRVVQPAADGSLVIAGSQDGVLSVLSTADWSESSLVGHENAVESVVFAPASAARHIARLAGHGAGMDTTNRYVASASRDKTVRIWDLVTGKAIRVLVGHTNWVRGLAFHPEGRYLVSCSDDRSLRVWDLEDDACRCCEHAENVHSGFVNSIRWNVAASGNSVRPTGSCSFATGGSDRAVCIF